MTGANPPVKSPRSLCVQRSRTFAEPLMPRSASETEMPTGSLVGGVAAGMLVMVGRAAAALAPAELSASSTGGGAPRRPRPGDGGGEVLNRATYLSFDPGTSATHAT